MKTKLLLEKKQYFLDIIKHAEDAITEIDKAIPKKESVKCEVTPSFQYGPAPYGLTILETDTEYVATFRGHDDLTDDNVVITKVIKWATMNI